MSAIQYLKQDQAQKLTMTVELSQALRVLLMPTQELQTYLQRESESNPLLELEEDDSDKEQAQEFEPEWLEYFDNGSDLGYISSTGKDVPTWEHRATQGKSLSQYLLAQWNPMARSEEEKEIGAFIIGNLDAAGYLRYTVAEIAYILGKSRGQVRQVLEAIQQIDSNGIAARDLRECLLIQAEAKGDLTPAIRTVISRYLPLLAEGRLGELAKKLDLSLPEMQIIRDYIGSLNPKPGFQHDDNAIVNYVIPDVTVEKAKEGHVVLVNDAVGSRLRINKAYRRILTGDGDVSDETKQYIQTQLKAAIWIVKSVEQRRLIIHRVVETLLRLQKPFFDSGLKHLRPLTLKEVADETDVHESTVSRATANKYIQTPHGIFSLRLLIGSGVGDSVGEGMAAESVMRVLADLVKNEDAKKPLSDPKLTELLGDKGIRISRRTVTKYRQLANIPPLSRRKRYL